MRTILLLLILVATLAPASAQTIAITNAHQMIGRRNPRINERCSGGKRRLSLFQINPFNSDPGLGFVTRLTTAHTAIQIQNTRPVRLRNGIVGMADSIKSDNGMVSSPAVSAPAWVVLFHKIPRRNIVAIPGVK